MRPKYLVPGLALLALTAAVIIVAGCSDDNVPTNQTTEGSLDDPVFIPVQNQISNYLDSSIEIFSSALDNSYRAPTDTQYVRVQYSPLGPNDTVVCAYAGGWYIVYVGKDNAYITLHTTDSIQFQRDGSVVENPLEMDYMHFVRRWDFVSKLTSVTHTNIEGRADLEFENLDGDMATINGTKELNVEWNYVNDDSNIVSVYEITAAIEDLTIYQSPGFGWSSGCPSSGSVRMEIAQSWTVTKGSVSNTTNLVWEVDIAINEGVAAVTVEGLNKIWHYTEDFCTPPVH
jgi:hypothetical protein